MNVSEHFKATIQAYVQQRAQEDPLFAIRYDNPKKNINDCITFILNTVKEMKVAGLTDDEVYSLAIHYYDEDDIKVGKSLKCQVVVNHTIELTETEKAEARSKAMQKAMDEAYKKITQGKSKSKKSDADTQFSLF